MPETVNPAEKSGANGMKFGDRVIYTIDGRHGVAGEFFQDGDCEVHFDSDGLSDGKTEIVKWRNLVKESTTSVPSTSDARVVNNVMRHEYRVLTDLEKELMASIKDSGLTFYSQIEAIEKVTSPSRELSLAKTKIEEAVFWAVKHLTK